MSKKIDKKLKALLKSPRVIFGGSVLIMAIFVAIFSKQLIQFDPEMIDLSQRAAPPSWTHVMGCDLNGADVLTSVILGTSKSLFIAFTTVTLTLIVGLTVGLITGYFQGTIDTIFMRIIDILMAFPGILLAMSLAALLGPSTLNIILAMACTGWTSMARLVRAQVLSLREREYITACKALGGSHLQILFKHIVPGVWSPVLVLATFSLSGVILIEASLSFLGLGSQEGAPTWGGLLNQGRIVLEEAPHLSIFPGICIILIVLSLNFLGDAFRDYLDPKQSH